MNVNEKIYNTMSSVGIGNLAVGVVVLITGIATGVLLIVNGARLIKRKSGMMI